MQLFDLQRTAQALEFGALVDALRAKFAAGCAVPPRQILPVPGDGTWLVMPAFDSQYLGLKSVTVHPGNAKRALPGVHAVYVLHAADTGAPVAVIDGGELTARRTAAVGALAASYLARPDASRLCVVGAGRIASLLPHAFAAVRPVARVDVWNHRAESRDALVQRLRAQGIDAHAAGDLRDAVAKADIVSCATLSTEPLIHADWLHAGQHVDLIGSFTPQMREIDGAAFARARVYVDTDEALVKSGDLLAPIAAGQFSATALAGTLATLCAGPETAGGGGITIFKSVGTALADLAAAELVLSCADKDDR